jgi:hypothetical protein
MLVLPGPGLLAIAAGINLLSKDIPWAQRLRSRFSSGGSGPAENQDGG